MDNGWRMKDVDEMDMLGYLRLRAWKVQKKIDKKKGKNGGHKFIDEVWPT